MLYQEPRECCVEGGGEVNHPILTDLSGGVVEGVGRGPSLKSLECKMGNVLDPESRCPEDGGLASWTRGHLNRHLKKSSNCHVGGDS